MQKPRVHRPGPAATALEAGPDDHLRIAFWPFVDKSSQLSNDPKSDVCPGSGDTDSESGFHRRRQRTTGLLAFKKSFAPSNYQALHSSLHPLCFLAPRFPGPEIATANYIRRIKESVEIEIRENIYPLNLNKNSLFGEGI